MNNFRSGGKRPRSTSRKPNSKSKPRFDKRKHSKTEQRKSDTEQPISDIIVEDESVGTDEKKKKKKPKKPRNSAVHQLLRAATAEDQSSLLWNIYTEHMSTNLSELEKQSPLTVTDIEFFPPGTSSLSKLLLEAIPSWSSLPIANGPLVIVIAQSGIRCADLCRDLRGLPGKVCKLFAKHLKIEDQVTALEKASIAVGTPNRIHKLCELEALKLSNCRLVVLDMSANEKQFTLLDQQQLQQDTVKWLHQYVLNLTVSRGPDSKLKIALFSPTKIAEEQQDYEDE